MKKGEWSEGMYLCEVSGHSLMKRISIRGDLENVAIELNPEFYKRKRRKKLTYITIPNRNKTTKSEDISPNRSSANALWENNLLRKP